MQVQPQYKICIALFYIQAQPQYKICIALFYVQVQLQQSHRRHYSRTHELR